METVGKILSITLLTIFGAAAGTVYLVDSNFISSVLNSTPTVYTYQESDALDSGNFSGSSVVRERSDKKYYEVHKERTNPAEVSEDKAVWGQKYDTSPSSNQYPKSRASALAKTNSYESLRKNMEYWDRMYREAVRSDQSSNADIAFSNYLDYKIALDIKQMGEQ